MALSHANHGHPATPAARAACRAAANVSLADAVDALRAISSDMDYELFTRLNNQHQQACDTHARLTNQRFEDVVLKVGLIVSMLPRR